MQYPYDYPYGYFIFHGLDIFIPMIIPISIL